MSVSETSLLSMSELSCDPTIGHESLFGEVILSAVYSNSRYVFSSRTP